MRMVALAYLKGRLVDEIQTEDRGEIAVFCYHWLATGDADEVKVRKHDTESL